MDDVRPFTVGQRVSDGKRALARQLRRRMTPAETVLWECLRDNRLAGLPFRRQQVVNGFVLDFLCIRAKLAVELDGPVHDTQVEADAERTVVLERRGLTVVRFSNRRVLTDLPAVLADLRRVAGA